MTLAAIGAFLKSTGLLSMFVFATIKAVKNFVPRDGNKPAKRKWINRALACLVGIAYAFMSGGLSVAFDTILIGLSAAGEAMVIHSAPKKVARHFNFIVS